MVSLPVKANEMFVSHPKMVPHAKCDNTIAGAVDDRRFLLLLVPVDVAIGMSALLFVVLLFESLA